MNARLTAMAVVAPLLVGPASAGLPPLGGTMNHVLVTLDADNAFQLSVERPGAQVLIEPPETYDGPAAVLNGTRFNAQHGWLVSGLWAPPAGGFVEIRQIDASPGLAVYAGRAFGATAFMDPICGTDGSDPAFTWDGVMLHNYYAATMPGLYEATYRVSIVDAVGGPIAGYTPGEITLSWVWGNGLRGGPGRAVRRARPRRHHGVRVGVHGRGAGRGPGRARGRVRPCGHRGVRRRFHGRVPLNAPGDGRVWRWRAGPGRKTRPGDSWS